MATMPTNDRIRFFINRFRERLWVKPLAVCLLSIAAAFIAQFADQTRLGEFLPKIGVAAVDGLLSIMAASMLVIATFAVASMVSAYASTSSTATPRTFALVVADDVSQNALSTFIGSFIFSIVALTAVRNDYFGPAGLFTLFALTLTVFGIVIYTFVRWVDRIARLGRLGATVDKVEAATMGALMRRRKSPSMQGVRADPQRAAGLFAGDAVFSTKVGYVQRVDVDSLQARAQAGEGRIVVAALPGAFAAPGRPLAYIVGAPGAESSITHEQVAAAFLIGDERLFDEDPRFGLVVLAEIAGRALSPAVNDPGTAIDIVGTLVRLFVAWGAPRPEDAEAAEPKYDRVEVPELAAHDMFDDAFTAIARDGAGTIEVALRLQKGLHALTLVGNPAMREAAMRHRRLALARAELAMTLPEDLEAVRVAAMR